MAISPIIERSYDFAGSIAVGAKMATDQEIADIKGIFGYVDREGFLGSIATLLHRVWNAVKALFGQSDWQRAERALQEVSARCIDKFAPPEVAFLAKATISGGIPSEAADQIIEALNKVNEIAKRMETAALPLFNQLLSLVDGEKIGADLARGIVPEDLIESFQSQMSNEEKYARTVQYALERGYIKPEGQGFFASLPGILQQIGRAQFAEIV
ncbi:hypothetical protein [Estrella lausannensis]|uniref:Uncharacterized protein n=1 Tax=Estrella lausannensis TaxID=483423 RepID=A0A0H5DR15_9BACT|nr:hypothetical protein [Estrella lausannensis]CRX39111.1 hypothetical protein ELAC_1785 [Estrella lausannensis]